MKRVIQPFLTIAGFAIYVLGASPVLSQNSTDLLEQDTKKAVVIQSEIKGMVSFIKGDYLKVVDEAGDYYLIRAASTKTLRGIRIGDNVNVTIRDGMAVSIKRVQVVRADE